MWLHSHGEVGAGELLRSLPSHLAWHLTSGCSGGGGLFLAVMNVLYIAVEKSLAEYTDSVFNVNECVLLPSSCRCVSVHSEDDGLYVS